MANPYLEDLQQSTLATGAAPGNPYLDMLQGAEEARQAVMSGQVMQAVKTNPDQYAAQKRVADALGYPLAAVEAMPDLAKQQAQVQAVQQATQGRPVLARKYADADFAKLAHDDHGTLAGVSDWFVDAAKYVTSHPDAQNTLAGALGAGAYDAARGASGLFQSVAELPAGLLDFMEATTPDEFAGWRGAVGGNPLRRLAEGFAMTGAGAKASASALSPARGGLGGAVDAGVRSLTQNLLTLPMALTPGGQTAALAGMVAITEGNAYQQAREQGLPMAQALSFALSQAAVEYATEKLPLEHLIGSLKTGAPIVQTLARQAGLEIPGEQIATVLQDLNEWAILPENAGKAFNDYIAERPNAALQTLVATMVGVGGNVAVGKAIEGVVGDAQERSAAQARAEQDAERVQQLFTLAAQSKLRERDPGSFATLVQEMADEGDAPSEVRFDARTLAETLQQSGLSEQEIAQALPSIVPQLAQAAATGGEVAVPLGELTQISGTPLEQTLLQHARIGENELSQAEAKEAAAQAEEFLKQSAERVALAAQDTERAAASVETVRQQLLDQLTAAKRFTADVNQSYATLAGQFYAVMADRLGTTPDALYTRYPLKVQAQGTQGERLNQDSPEFRKWFGDSKVVDEKGQPLVLYHGTGRDFESFSADAQSNHIPLPGFYFTPDPSIASTFAESAAKMDENRAGRPFAPLGANVIPAFLALKNPLDVDVSAGAEKGFVSEKVIRMVIDEAKRLGHDGLILRGWKDGSGPVQYVAFKPEQIKSAIGNRGAFDPNDPSILNQGPRGTAEQAIEQGYTLKAYRGVSKAKPFNDTGTTWLTTDRAVAEAYAEEVMGYDDPAVIEVMVKPDDMPQHDIRKMTDDELQALEPDDFGNPQKVGIYRNSDDHPLGGKRGVTVIHAPREAVFEILNELAQGPRGTYNPGTLTISLLEKADLSTFLHETGHFFLEALADIASQPGAPAQVVDDMGKVLAWFGVKDLATWQGMTLDQQRKFHERFAESFEQYLLEGKAPSAELTPLFQRFRAWLTNVYRSLTQFMAGHNTQMTEEVRAVFDRLLATEDQIKQAEALRAYEPLFKSAAEAGMAPEAWAAYQAQGDKATATAIDTLQARSMRDMRWTTRARGRALKALQKESAEKRKAIEAEVRAEVAKEPVYQAQHWLRKGEMTTPEGEEIKAEKGFRLNTAALAEMYPDSMLARPELDRLKGLTAANGLHPDVVAEMFGFDSGDQLVRALTEAEPLASVVEGKTDQRMLERFGDLSTAEGLERAADEAVHNEARARFVATELRALQEANGKTERTPAGGSVNVMVRAAKQFAGNLIARRKVRELKPGQHTAAESRAARAAQQALRKGDTQAAIVAKRDELLNHYAARTTNEAIDRVERGVEYLKKFDKDATRKKLPPEYLDQIDKLLERVDLRKTSNKALDKRAKLAAWIEEQKAMGVEPDIPDYLLEDSQLASYRDMTVEQFDGLVDTVKQVEHLGRLKGKLLTAKDQREFAAIVDSIVQSIVGNAGKRTADTRTPTTNLGRSLAAVKAFGAAHVKAATWARILDGGKDGGPVWEYLVRSANEAGDREAGMVAKATEDLSRIMAPVLARAKLGGSGQHFPSIGRSLNRESVLAIALNTGNESNLQRLLGGEGWTLDQLQPVLASLDAQDWQAVQSIWDYFETFRPMIAEKERRIFGKEPAWIEPGSPVTEWGGTFLPAAAGVRGGYYPVKYDPAASQRAEEHADAEGAKRQLQGAYGAATTRRSFTKGRAEEVTGRPLLYTLNGVYSGVSEVVHDLAWHEWLIDVNRLLRSRAIDSAIREKYGPEVVRQFKAWRDDIAEGDAGPQRALDMALGKLRQSVSVAGLGFNVVSAMMQPLGLAQSVQRVGAGWIARGVWQTIGEPVKASRAVNEKSKFMANRARTRFRELNELRNRVQGQSVLKQAINQNAYRLMMAFQRLVDVPTWQGAYEKAVAEGNDEKRAVALADQAVIDSQGGGQTKDLAAIERGPQALKLFTVFYSFMNTALNLGVASKMTPRSRARFAADMLLLYVVPAVLGKMLKDAITPGDADDEELAKKLAAEQLSFLLGLFVVGREFGQVGSIVMGEQARDYTGPAGLRAVGDAYQFAKQAGQGEFDDAFRKASINLAGDLLGLPSAQINRSITGAKAMAEGKTQNPAALALGYQEP